MIVSIGPIGRMFHPPLIPAVSFEMGDHLDEWVMHQYMVELDAFYVDAHEVTVGQFKQFVADSGYAYNWWNQIARY